MSDGDGALLRIDPAAWLAPTAIVTGRVAIAEGSSVWHHAVLRAECEEITIGRMTNVQDFAMVHVGFDHATRIGDFCSITHHATVHGATLGNAVLVGIGAVIMDGVVIGDGSIVAGGAVVPEGKVFPPKSVIGGVPAKLLTERDSARANRLNAWHYHRNAQLTRAGNPRAWDGPEYEAWLAEKSAEIEADGDL